MRRFRRVSEYFSLTKLRSWKWVSYGHGENAIYYINLEAGPAEKSKKNTSETWLSEGNSQPTRRGIVHMEEQLVERWAGGELLSPLSLGGRAVARRQQSPHSTTLLQCSEIQTSSAIFSRPGSALLCWMTDCSLQRSASANMTLYYDITNLCFSEYRYFDIWLIMRFIRVILKKSDPQEVDLKFWS